MVDVLNQLSDEALQGLHSLADDTLFSIEFGRRVGQAGATLHGQQELQRQELIQAASDYPAHSDFVTLSNKGQQLARIILFTGQVPPELESIRDRVHRIGLHERKA